MTPALWPVTGTIEPPTVRAEVSNEDIERLVGNQPRDVVRKLPDCPERADALKLALSDGGRRRVGAREVCPRRRASA